MTGEDHADASAMVEYFQPLLEWLKDQNQWRKTGLDGACRSAALTPVKRLASLETPERALDGFRGS